MRSNTARIAIAVGALAVVVVLFVVLNGGDDSGDKQASTTTSTQSTTSPTDEPKTQEPAVPVIEVRDGKPVGGIRKLTFTKGDRVQFRVQSDVADEIHVHGYDLKKEVAAGGSVSFSFQASIEGVFEVELEELKEQIAQLSVNPA